MRMSRNSRSILNFDRNNIMGGTSLVFKMDITLGDIE